MNRSILESIIVEGDAQVTVEQAEALGRDLFENRLSTSQIRNIFGTVRRIEMSWPDQPKDEAERQQAQQAKRDLLLLKPKMAYQAKRERGRGVKTLTDVLADAIELVQGDRQRFQHLVDFFEATLAYHRAHGGN
jgi:CRISPR-associated protein Csm2